VTPLRIAFFGTPAFAVPTLERLVSDGHAIPAVVTQPDRPRGRGQKPTPGPVKAFAQAHGLRVLQPERLKDDAFLSLMATLDLDVGVVAAYGKILPQGLLDIPRLGMVNVHASLLPRWRGASPVHRAIIAGDAETGVSIMRVVRELDAGGVYATTRRAIDEDETSEDVERDIAVLGAALLASSLPGIASGTLAETPQPEAGVTYAPRLTKEEGLISWLAPARAIHNQVRGLHPWPHAYTSFDEARVIVLRTAVPHVAAAPVPPGEVVGVDNDGILVAADAGDILRLVQLQLEGRRPVSGREFAAGARLPPGRRFGTWPP
jgi:methionyl-tRNA formyltransferase